MADRETLSAIYSEVNGLLCAGCFDKVGDLLEGTLDGRGLHDADVDIMLAYLTATLPAKTLVPGRAEYFTTVRSELIRQAKGRQDLIEMLVDTTLSGLE